MRRAQLASAENRRRERVSCFEIAQGALAPIAASGSTSLNPSIDR
jgi:hypothetical protein